MRFITPQLEKELNYQEADPFSPLGARQALEEVLTFQLSALADGLLAGLTLRGVKIDALNWWQHYLTKMLKPPTRYAPDLQDPDYLAYRKQFAQDVAAR